MIVKELSRLQHEHGYLPEASVRALSGSTGLPLYRIWEVASFFPHFRTETPPEVQAHVCQDMSCRLRGACDLLDAAQRVADESPEGAVAVHGVSCLGRCDRAPAAIVNEQLFVGRGPQEFAAAIEAARGGSPPPADRDADLTPPVGSAQSGPAWTIDVYDGSPRYDAVRAYVERDRPEPKRVIDALETAGLLGMGGAGGRAYKKWNDVRVAVGDEKFVVCNADESEPGTFKDRDLLIRAPWLVLEGMILGGLVVGAERGYVYIRHEYHEAIEAVRDAIEKARALGACGDAVFGSDRSFDLEVFVSPGGYICGEQTALIEAMEDHRAEPRNRPPQLQTNGLWDKPTLLNNVETFAWVPAIALRDDGAWFASEGRGEQIKGRRFFSISGDVNAPGAYEVPNGITLRELIEDYAGGVRGGREFKAVAPSGPSGGFLPRRIPVEAMSPRFVESLPDGATHYDVLDWPLDIATSRKMGLMLGAGIVVYAEGVDMIDQAWACTRFYRDESCGKCVPCRIGAMKLVDIAERIRSRDFDAAALADTAGLVGELGETMESTSICGLGQSAPAPLRTLLRFFRDDTLRHLSNGA